MYVLEVSESLDLYEIARLHDSNNHPQIDGPREVEQSGKHANV